MIDVEDIKPKIKELAKKYSLSLVVLFGSQATGHVHTGSDIDIAVISRDKVNTSRLMREMSEIFKNSDVQVVDLSLASPTLMYAVIKEGKVLYENETGAFFKWKLYAIKI